MKSPSICEEQIFLEVHTNQEVPLRNFLFYRFGSLEKAKDCTQEAFSTLWENCAKVPFEKAKSYLFTVANRKFLDSLDHDKVVLKFQKRESISEAQLETSPEYIYRKEEFQQRLEEVVSDLPEKQRVVFLMSRIDKMQNKEIASTLDVSIKTVEKHISTSLKSIKDKLDEIGNFKL